jgi:hypothetical protein
MLTDPGIVVAEVLASSTRSPTRPILPPAPR